MLIPLDVIDSLQVTMPVATPRAIPVAMPLKCPIQIAMATVTGFVLDRQLQVNGVRDLVELAQSRRTSTGDPTPSSSVILNLNLPVDQVGMLCLVVCVCVCVDPAELPRWAWLCLVT